MSDEVRQVTESEWRTVLGILKRLCDVELYNSRKVTRRRSWEEDACRIEALLTEQPEPECEHNWRRHVDGVVICAKCSKMREFPVVEQQAGEQEHE